jgi:hypothetical protein
MPQGGDRLSHKTEAHADLIHAALNEVPDITLPELKARLAEQGGMAAPFVLDGAMNRCAFETYVARVLVPNFGRATSSSWTTCPATRGPACGS